MKCRVCVLKFLAPASVALAALCGPPARAQSVETELQEVVVTAEKTREPAQTTPISMAVYSAGDIQAKGIKDIESLASADTSLNFDSGGGEPYLTLRGISSSDTTEIGDPTVPVAVDGFFVNRSYALLTSLYDLERIEVLRGPQGTLYGRNAAGGVVNIITQKPTQKFEASGSIEAGNFNTLNFGGTLNLPFSDSMQLRAAFISRAHDGYRTVYPGLGLTPQRGDDEDVRSGRVELAVEPFDHFHGLLTVESTRTGGVGEVIKQIPLVASATIPGDVVHQAPGLADTDRWNTYDPTSLSLDDKTYKWEFTYDGLPRGLQVTYVGGFDNLQWHHITPGPGLLGDPPTTPISIVQNEYPKTQNHELRLASAPGGVFTWQGGAFFFEERSRNLETYALEGAGTPDASQPIAFEFPLVESTSRALFGQGSVSLTDTVRATAGARYTVDSKERTGIEALPVFGIPALPDAGSGRWSKTTGHFGVDWTPTTSNFEYAKVDTGYKAGGFASCNEYQPETVTTVEVGSKNRLRERTVQFNVAAFYSKYSNQQVSLNVPLSVCAGASTVENAGSSKIYGLEWDANALLGPVGRLDVDVTYLHARFDSFLAAPGIPAATADCRSVDASGNCQLAGNTLPQAPQWTAAVDLERGWQLAERVKLTGRLESKYQSTQQFDAFNYASTTQKGYAVENASLDLERDNWTVGLWVRNLADKVYLIHAQEDYTDNSYDYGFGAPRTFGVRLSVSLH
jgi:iron complex outermembrane recepter protein